jgi:thioredoxin 1
MVTLVVVLYFTMYRAHEQTRRIPEVEKSANALAMVERGETPLPRLIDLGADKCIPCKMMAPILEELKREYDGVFEVEIIDVWKNPKEVKRFGLKGIPTQIFFDAAGQELYRHMGFLSRVDILRKWKELGVPIDKEARDE